MYPMDALDLSWSAGHNLTREPLKQWLFPPKNGLAPSLGEEIMRQRTTLNPLLFLAGVLGSVAACGLPRDVPAQETKVITERLRGQWRKQDDFRMRLTGKAAVIDANTLIFEDGTRVLLAGGSDAPELGQQARVNGAFYPCGKAAAEFLKKLIAGRPVSFYAFESLRDRDPQNRLRGACFAGETDLGMELVRNGWALAAHSGMEPYEIIARANKRGLWRGDFVIPDQWRAGKRLPGEPLEVSPQGKALAALRKFDAIVRVEERSLDRPITAIEFRPNVATKPRDGDLALLESFPRLHSVAFPSNPITDAGLEHLHKLADLEEVNLNWSKVTPAGVLRLIKGRKKLRRLELSGVDLRDEHLQALKDLTALETLNLRSTLITDQGVAQLASLTNLRNLNISTNRGRITDAALEAIKPMKTLQYLDLDRTAITDAGLVHLGAMRHLLGLQFAHTAITDAGLEHLRSLSKLTSLNSRGTKITRAGREKLARALPLLDNGHPRVHRRYAGEALATITGKAEVLDAHTLRFADGTLIELNGGIDAPELDQTAKLGDELYPCGKQAADFLKSVVGEREVTFYFEGERGQKLHGDCFVGELCLQIEMVRSGWAVSHHTGMDSWQSIADENKRGLWRGDFVRPEAWLKGKRLPGEPLLSELDTLEAYHADQVVFSRDGKLLAAAYGGPAVKLWSVRDRTELLRGSFDEEHRWCRAVALAPGGNLLAAADAAGTIKLWDVPTRKLLTTLLSKSDDDTKGLAFSADGKTLLRGGHSGVHVWDLATRSEIAEWKRPNKRLSAFALSHDGHLAATGYDDGGILIRDAASGKELRTLVGHDRIVWALAFSADDKALASGGWDKKVKVWDVAAWQIRCTLRGGIGLVRSVAFAPTGPSLAMASLGGPMTLWDLGSQRQLTSLVTGGFSVAFSPDGTLLATGAGDGPVKLWRVRVTK
jgi:endonuclease YncB( thermonuclease family)